MALTKGQRAYTSQYVTVDQTESDRRAGNRWTAYLVTHNPLMATKSRRIIRHCKNYREAAIVALGFSQAKGVKLSSRVEVY